MEQKKPTKKQLEKKLNEATVFVDKAEKSIYLADIGVGIYITKFQTVLSTDFHRHVWENINSVGYSGVYRFLNAFVDICLNNLGDITYKDKNNNIYRQYNLYERKKLFTHGEIDIREERSIINFNQNFNDLSQGL